MRVCVLPLDYTCFLFFRKFMEDATAYDFDRYCSFYYTHSVNNKNNEFNNNNYDKLSGR